MNLRVVALIGALASVGLVGPVSAESVATVPEGYVTVTIAAGSGTGKTRSVISLPLLRTSVEQGLVVGRIASVTSSTVTISNAGWTPGSLSQPASPYAIRFLTGAAKGLTLLISRQTPNTANTIAIDSGDASYVDLTLLGLQTGDTGDLIELISCDTIGSVFGTPQTTGVQGSTSPDSADVITILSVFGAPQSFYYHTTLGRWTRQALGNPDGTHTPIRPDAGLIYQRIGTTPIELTVLGRVPSTDRLALIKNSGLTYLSNSWPVQQTLMDTRIHQIPGWLSGSSASLADVVSVGFSNYFFDGSNWRRQALGSPIANPVIPVGSAVLVNRKGSAPGATLVEQAKPYNLAP